MKELSIEEKAKAYDKALDRAKEWLNIKEPFTETCTCVVESIFPELKESEDEKIRKDIIYFLSRNTFQFGEDIDKYKSWIAWLEKQGQVKESAISQHDNTTCKENDNSLTLGKSASAFTIIDAKDGDVLAGKIDGDSYILIYKQIKDGWIETYGHYYDSVDRFCVPSQLFCREGKGTFYPATKEQRDLLFSKMKEAGYTWDAEKKELKKPELCNADKQNTITAWIARDKSGEVLLYEEKPVKLKNDPVWESPDGGSLGIKELPEGINPKWEDEEATEVELIIRSKK